MARVKLIRNKEDIAPEHHALFEELAALRGRISGPSTVVLHSPGLAKPWNEVSEHLHRQSMVEPQHAELAVCATAREKDCGYIWNAHVPAARKAGVSDRTIAAVRERRGLEGLAGQEATVVRYVRQLLQGNRVDADVFDALLKGHGTAWMVELTAWIGRYGALAGILNGFELTPENPAEVLPVGGSRRAEARATNVPPPAATPRVTPITSREQMEEKDQGIFDAVGEGRGSVRGPWAILMYSPPLCQRIFDVSNYLRFQSEVEPGLRELATIATAREKDCPYVWAAHAPAARKEGVSPEAIAAVRDREDAAGLGSQETGVIQYVREQLRGNRVSQDLFDRLKDAHGVRWLVELTCLIGHCGFVTGILNAFEVAPAADAEQLPL